MLLPLRASPFGSNIYFIFYALFMILQLFEINVKNGHRYLFYFRFKLNIIIKILQYLQVC